MGKYDLIYKNEQRQEQKKQKQGVTYPTATRVTAPKSTSTYKAPVISWSKDEKMHFKSGDTAVDDQTKLEVFESVKQDKEFARKAADGNKKWKSEKSYQDGLTKDPKFKKFEDFMKKNHFAGTVEGVSSIPYLLGKDNSRYEPGREWTVDQNNIYYFLYNQNPKEAATYAQLTNDDYKRKNEEKVKQWAEDHQGLAMVSTWLDDQLALAEMQNNVLTYARDGQFPYTKLVTPSRHNNLVDDTLRDILEKQDKGSSVVYDQMKTARNGLYYDMLDKTRGKGVGTIWKGVNEFSDGFNDSLYAAQDRGVADDTALMYAGAKGLLNVGSDWLGGKPSESVWRGPLSTSEDIRKQAVDATIGASIDAVADQIIEQFIMKENSKYNIMVNDLCRTMTIEEAEDEAWRILGSEMIQEVLKNLSGGVAYGGAKHAVPYVFGK